MFAAPSHMITPATGIIQKLNALIRGNAMSFAPMSGGTLRVPKPARGGVGTRQVIVVPGVLNNLGKVFASTIGGPREGGSVPIHKGGAPPMGENRKGVPR